MALRRLINSVIGLAVLGLILLLIIRSDFTVVYQQLKQLSLRMIAILVLLQITSIVAVSFQWQQVFKMNLLKVPFMTILIMNFYGTFFESITPAMKTGGEGFKLIYLKRLNIAYSNSITVLFLQKLLSFSAFVVVLIISLVLAFNRIETAFLLELILRILFIFAVIAFIGFIIVTYLKKHPKFTHSVENVKNLLRNNPRTLIFTWVLGIGIWLLYALKIGLILMFFNVAITWIEIGYTTYIAYAVGLLPLSPGGLGTFEATLTYLFTHANIPYNMALTVTLIFRFFSHWFVFILSGIVISTQSLIGKRRLKNDL